jgi:hypothetical protein
MGDPMKRAVTVVLAGAFVVAACGDDSGGSVEAFCESAQEFADAGDFFDTNNPEDFSAGLEEAREVINALADDAPSEISDDAETVAEVSGELFDSLADIDPTDQAAVEAAFAPFFDADADPEFAAAVDNVNDFALAECGIDLEGSDG